MGNTGGCYNINITANSLYGNFIVNDDGDLVVQAMHNNKEALISKLLDNNYTQIPTGISYITSITNTFRTDTSMYISETYTTWSNETDVFDVTDTTTQWTTIT